MRQIARVAVTDGGATVPAEVLRTLGGAVGDTIAFVDNADGSISLVKATRPVAAATGRICEIVGVFSTGTPRTPAEDAAFLHAVRYGDESDDG